MNGDNIYAPGSTAPTPVEDEEDQVSTRRNASYKPGTPPSPFQPQAAFSPLPQGVPSELPPSPTSVDAGDLPHSFNPSQFNPPPVDLDPRRVLTEELHRDYEIGPKHVEPSLAQKLGAVLLAGSTGWAHPGSAEGTKEAMTLYNQPQEEENRKFQQRVGGLERQVGDIDKERQLQRQDKMEADQADFRRRQEKHMDWVEGGGPETAKMTAEQKYRDSQVDSLKKAGYSDQELAEFRATGKTRDNMPKTDMEAITMAHEIGPDGKPTPRALQAAAAHRQYVQDRIREIKAARDPNDQVKLVQSYMSDITAQRGQMDAELKAIQADKTSIVDPVKLARAKQLQQTIQGLDDDLGAARDFIGQRVPGLARPKTPGRWNAKTGRYE
jgi:hypothetical protein